MKLGIIGGSGLEDPKILQNYQEKQVDSPYGKPSSPLILGKINNMEIVIISRHGKGHLFPPTQINYRANIYTLAKEKCTHVIATTACGSLREEIKRGDFIILDQFIDFTRHRKISFYDKFENKPIHVSTAEPFSKFLREKLIQSARELELRVHEKGTVITIEGPRFSTRAESNMFRQWGADVINMSIAPEAILAREAELEYAVVAMSTDYDCWRESEEAVSWEMIEKILKQNAENVTKLLLKTIENLSKYNELEQVKRAIRTIPNWPKYGVMFRDITTLLKDPEVFNFVIEKFYERYKDKKIDKIVGIESRGFIISSILAHKLNKPLILARKPNKLPAEHTIQEYELEYGKDAIAIHNDAISSDDSVLVIDDLCATGNTLRTTAEIVEKLGGKVYEIGYIIDLPYLKGKEKLSKWQVFNLIEFVGE